MRTVRWSAGLWLALAGTAGAQVEAPAPAAKPPSGWARWFDPATAPFIPVPEIDVDPNAGTTLGLIPTWLITNDKGEIEEIIAPDILYNTNFGVGARGRIFSYPSSDRQWSVVGGGKQRVESEFDFEYQTGRDRSRTWSFNSSVVYDRSGTPRFYGIGNNSPAIDVTNYTEAQRYVQTLLGWNITHALQIGYTVRVREVEVEPGTLAHIASIQKRFAELLGIGRQHEVLNRAAITYDTRDDLTIPRHGGAYVVYGGVAANEGFMNATLYSVVGFDGRQLWSVSRRDTLAAHAALRYMPGVTGVPFWSLSTIGGDQANVGDAQPLRGFGTGRFYDRNLFSASFEDRHQVLSFDAAATHIDLEVTPFVDVGRVFNHSRSSPFAHLHHVAGVGFRGIAAPFVVGYVDFGVGTEGLAVFTGINYPF